jgi:hypothetical protein
LLKGLIMLKGVFQCIPTVNMFNFGQFNLLLLSLTPSFLFPIIQQLSGHFTNGHRTLSCFLNIMKYGMFPSLLYDNIIRWIMIPFSTVPMM